MSGVSTGGHLPTKRGKNFTTAKALFNCRCLIHKQSLSLLVQRKSALWNQSSPISRSFERNATDIGSCDEHSLGPDNAL